MIKIVSELIYVPFMINAQLIHLAYTIRPIKAAHITKKINARPLNSKKCGVILLINCISVQYIARQAYLCGNPSME